MKDRTIDLEEAPGTMAIIDLTYPIATGMPVYPGSPSPEIHSIARFEADGVDTLSVDAADALDYPVHRTLLEKEVLIIENLAHLDRLPAGPFQRLCCLPLHLADADGAPVRVVAML